MSERSPKRHLWLLIAAVTGLLALAVAGSFVLYDSFVKPAAEVSNPTVEFIAPPPRPEPTRRAKRLAWPIFGRTPDRTRTLRVTLRPPFKRVWRRRGGELQEFPPVLAKGRLYVVNKVGAVRAISARTGRAFWRRKVGRLSASSPAWWRDRLFVVSMSGRVVALWARTGKPIWSRRIARSESSPLVVRGRLFFGDDAGVHALRARDGKRLWFHRTPGYVRSALAYSRGKLFFGDYSGGFSALRARDGRKLWRVTTRGASFSRAGAFYSTPAVAFGRVYAGNADGKVYSFSTRNGRIAWTRQTDDEVYGGPTPSRVAGTPPSIYVGSIGGTFYAFDARSGRTRWTYRTEGRVLGSATLIGRVVYFAVADAKYTLGLDVRRGRRVFYFPDGEYTPVISDGQRLYLTGYSRQYALVPKRKRDRALAHRSRTRLRTLAATARGR